MRLHRRWSVAVLALAWGAAPSHGQSSARARREQLRRVEKQLEQKRSEIDAYKRQADSLRRDLSKLADASSESRKDIRALEGKIRDAESRKAEIRARLGSLQLAEDRWRGVISEELNAYVRRSWAASDYFGKTDLWEGAYRRAALLEKLRYISQLHGTQRRAQALEAEASRQKETLQARSRQANSERETRDTLYRQAKEVYDAAQRKLADSQREVRDLRDSEAALARLVQSLGRRSPAESKTTTARPPPAPHSLPWPVQGTVVGRFGKQQVAALHTWVINQGIRLAASVGAPVRAVKPGKVIFAGPFRSYGRVVIVDHGDAWFTIYGNLGRMSKTKGDRVGPSDVLGTVGPRQNGGLGAGDAPPTPGAGIPPAGEGGGLYLELRHNGDALDPLAWLEKR